ncbi:MAG: DNA mismatch repair endonuclease MutL, partial [Magnetococcales bacterium]|nr:DNA mismatch repair endonuclease MutL [Magnetococcales bacterium]
MNTSSPHRHEIKVLPTTLANQIAAGEVVERPASVVKELLENSLDAAATQIEVRIEQGGRRLIQVSDNGCGMTAPQARLALERHATSKIASVDDLFSIRTLGFRGEALPSIGSVAHLELESRVPEEVDGVAILVRGGEVTENRRVAMLPGTSVTVRNLFFNTPARLKFLSSDRTETTHITDLVLRLALGYPQVGFKLHIDARPVVELRPSQDEQQMRTRLAIIFGREFPDHCLEFVSDHDHMHLFGWLGLPNLHRANASGVHLFVNGRWVRDRAIQHALREAYGDALPKGRHPVLALFLDIAADAVDVNVHPTKQEVRFRQGHLIYALVRRALTEALAGHGGGQTMPPAAGVWSPEQATQGRETVIATLPTAASRPVTWQESTTPPPERQPRPASTFAANTGYAPRPAAPLATGATTRSMFPPASTSAPAVRATTAGHPPAMTAPAGSSTAPFDPTPLPGVAEGTLTAYHPDPAT